MTRSRRTKRIPLVVLVAEDEPTVRALTESILEEIGFKTLSAATGREALAVLEDQSVHVDILFTDINMPDIAEVVDGLQLAQQAVELRPGLRVIYTSGGGATDGTRAMFVEGASFLSKPYTREQLLEVMRHSSE